MLEILTIAKDHFSLRNAAYFFTSFDFVSIHTFVHAKLHPNAILRYTRQISSTERRESIVSTLFFTQKSIPPFGSQTRGGWTCVITSTFVPYDTRSGSIVRLFYREPVAHSFCGPHQRPSVPTKPLFYNILPPQHSRGRTHRLFLVVVEVSIVCVAKRNLWFLRPNYLCFLKLRIYTNEVGSNFEDDHFSFKSRVGTILCQLCLSEGKRILCYLLSSCRSLLTLLCSCRNSSVN